MGWVSEYFVGDPSRPVEAPDWAMISAGGWCGSDRCSTSSFISTHTRPLSAALMGTAAFLLVLALLPTLRKKRDEVFVESES